LAISREKKERLVSELSELFSRSSAVVLSDYRGLSAGQMAELRNKLRPVDSKFTVAKNRLIRRSLEESDLPALDTMLEGPTALSFIFGEYGEPLRAMKAFAKETEMLNIKGGLLGNRVLSAADVQVLMDLPSTDVLRAQVLSGVQSPVSGLAGMLDGVLRGLLYVMSARADQMGEANA
jgi:large subunit ribosomal protein L10